MAGLIGLGNARCWTWKFGDAIPGEEANMGELIGGIEFAKC
jgi:hypothetical protein